MDNSKPAKMVKKPTNARIRSALTTLKKAELTIGNPVVGEFYTDILLQIPNELMAPKKTRKVRLKHKWVEKPTNWKEAEPYEFKKDL